MPRTDTTIRAAKPADKPYNLSDSLGLYLLIQPSGSRWWRLKYRFQSCEKLLSLGVYPEVSLRQARIARDEARRLIASGVNPSAERKAASAAHANTFKSIAREWHATFSPRWAPATATRVLSALERDAFPHIGNLPVSAITAPQVLQALRRVEARAAYSAGKLRQFIGQVLRYAVATGRAERDPTVDLKGALATPPTKHMAAITDPVELGHLLRAMDGYTGALTTRTALRLAPMLFVRPGELRAMRWADLDLDGARPVWTIPAPSTKSRRDHIVPLARQAVELLRTLHPLTGHRPHVFPALTGSRPMSENTINAALRRLGYDTQATITGHGFRAMARTILHETLGYPPEVIEHQLAHAVPDALGAAYNRTRFLPRRHAMMQAWADHLDALRTGADILPFHRAMV